MLGLQEYTYHNTQLHSSILETEKESVTVRYLHPLHGQISQHGDTVTSPVHY